LIDKSRLIQKELLFFNALYFYKMLYFIDEMKQFLFKKSTKKSRKNNNCKTKEYFDLIC